MSKIEVEIVQSGIIELMKSQEIQDFLLSEADSVVSKCDGSYDTNVYVGKTRANASIITHDRSTFFKNLKDNELLKALRV